jgi:hypothetical protein
MVLTIAHNTLADGVRRRQVEARARRRVGIRDAMSFDSDELDRIDALAGNDQWLTGLLDGLSRDQADAICARVLDERGYPEIAAELQTSELVIRKRVSRGLAMLRRELKRRNADDRSPHRSPPAPAVVVALGVVIAVAVLAIALLAHKRTAATSPAGIPAVDRYRLTGHGIGDIAFGDRPAAVAAGLERLLGRPATASATSRIGYVRSICGFDHEIDWSGLAARPNGSNSDGLTVYFKHSRFVGYSYGPPYGGPHAPAVRREPMLHTAGGLGLDDKLTRGRQLDGRAFIATRVAATSSNS